MFSPSVGKGFTPERIECVPTASLKDKLRANIEQDGQDEQRRQRLKQKPTAITLEVFVLVKVLVLEKTAINDEWFRLDARTCL